MNTGTRRWLACLAVGIAPAAGEAAAADSGNAVVFLDHLSVPGGIDTFRGALVTIDDGRHCATPSQEEAHP